MNGRGRVILRPSGTEPLMRVTLEGEDEAQINCWPSAWPMVVQRRAGRLSGGPGLSP